MAMDLQPRLSHRMIAMKPEIDAVPSDTLNALCSGQVQMSAQLDSEYMTPRDPARTTPTFNVQPPILRTMASLHPKLAPAPAVPRIKPKSSEFQYPDADPQEEALSEEEDNYQACGDSDEDEIDCDQERVYRRAVWRAAVSGGQKTSWCMRNPGRCERCIETNDICLPKKAGNPICLACRKRRGKCSRMESFQVETAASALKISVMESQRRYDLWIKHTKVHSSHGCAEPRTRPVRVVATKKPDRHGAIVAMKTSSPLHAVPVVHRREKKHWQAVNIQPHHTSPPSTSTFPWVSVLPAPRRQGPIGYEIPPRYPASTLQHLDTPTHAAARTGLAPNDSMRGNDSQAGGSSISKLPAKSSLSASVGSHSELTKAASSTKVPRYECSSESQSPSSSVTTITPGNQPNPAAGERLLLPKKPHIEELRNFRERNLALEHDLSRANSAKEALEREMEPLRAFHERWSQHDLEALITAGERLKTEEERHRVKIEERDAGEVGELEEKLSTLGKAHKSLKAERDALHRSHQRLLQDVKECESFLGTVFLPIVESDPHMRDDIIKKIQVSLHKSISACSTSALETPPQSGAVQVPSALPSSSSALPQASGSDCIHRSSLNDPGYRQQPSSEKRKVQSHGGRLTRIEVEESDSDIEVIEVKRGRRF